MTRTALKLKPQPKLQIQLGRFQMRNGATVEVEKRYDIPYLAGREELTYSIWVGHCIETGCRCSWQLDGHYSPSGLTHDWDLVEAL